MAQPAQEHDLEPRQVSFKGALQTLVAFPPQVVPAPTEELADLAKRIQAAITQHQVGDRPDRYEPRAWKRQYDNFKQLRPRAEVKALLLKGVCEESK